MDICHVFHDLVFNCTTTVLSMQVLKKKQQKRHFIQAHRENTEPSSQSFAASSWCSQRQEEAAVNTMRCTWQFEEPHCDRRSPEGLITNAASVSPSQTNTDPLKEEEVQLKAKQDADFHLLEPSSALDWATKVNALVLGALRLQTLSVPDLLLFFFFLLFLKS